MTQFLQYFAGSIVLLCVSSTTTTRKTTTIIIIVIIIIIIIMEVTVMIIRLKKLFYLVCFSVEYTSSRILCIARSVKGCLKSSGMRSASYTC